MPTLFRFIFILGVLGGIALGGIFALATFVRPDPREMTVTIPQDQLNKRR